MTIYYGHHHLIVLMICCWYLACVRACVYSALSCFNFTLSLVPFLCTACHLMYSWVLVCHWGPAHLHGCYAISQGIGSQKSPPAYMDQRV